MILLDPFNESLQTYIVTHKNVEVMKWKNIIIKVCEILIAVLSGFAGGQAAGL